jgi:hypothetical protein
LPHLTSVRKLEEYIAFDMSFPTAWKIPKKFVDEERTLFHQSTGDERLVSFVSKMDENDMDKVINNLKTIIKYNQEREEKELLFQKKVEEMKVMFEKSTLENLKTLTIQIKTKMPKLNENEETIGGLALEGDGEG